MSNNHNNIYFFLEKQLHTQNLGRDKANEPIATRGGPDRRKPERPIGPRSGASQWRRAAGACVDAEAGARAAVGARACEGAPSSSPSLPLPPPAAAAAVAEGGHFVLLGRGAGGGGEERGRLRSETVKTGRGFPSLTDTHTHTHGARWPGRQQLAARAPSAGASPSLRSPQGDPPGLRRPPAPRASAGPGGPEGCPESGVSQSPLRRMRERKGAVEAASPPPPLLSPRAAEVAFLPALSA